MLNVRRMRIKFFRDDICFEILRSENLLTENRVSNATAHASSKMKIRIYI